MNLNLLIILLILITIVVTLKPYETFSISHVYENFQIQVRKNDDQQSAADLLATINNNMRKLVYYCKYKLDTNKEYPNSFTYIKEYEQNIMMMYNKIDSIVLRETEEGTNNTSYTINKGEEMVICLRSKKNNKFHDMNELMYVTIHELAHVGNPELDHTPLFYKINKFLLKEAIELGIYRYVNYNIDSKDYCGIDLNNTIL